MSLSLHNSSGDHGFSLIEVFVALSILVVGLAALALVSSRMMSGGTESKYMSIAASLASEKLEDLNRWDGDDPQVGGTVTAGGFCVTGTNTVGSLTSDVIQTTPAACNSSAAPTVNYFDDVTLATVNGAISETVSSVSAGNTVYTTTTQTPNGQVPTVTTGSTAPTSATFHRRWVIEGNSPVTGVRRVTVLVTLLDTSVKPPVTFQMSMVRP